MSIKAPICLFLVIILGVACGNRHLTQLIQLINVGTGDYYFSDQDQDDAGDSDNVKSQFTNPDDDYAYVFANLTTESIVFGDQRILQFTQGDQEISAASNSTNVTTDSEAFGRGIIYSDSDTNSLLSSATFQQTVAQAIGDQGFAAQNSDFLTYGFLVNGQMALQSDSSSTTQVVNDDGISFLTAGTASNATSVGSNSTITQRGGTASRVSNDLGQASCNGGSSGNVTDGGVGADSGCVVQGVFLPSD
eukprot:TRINITY_DN12212_c1_g1_i1.p1 TRINITY_DN12212_c1_g1~~TRINITY_DN12212_c1_g1_i1.p1  ORF type:complete len:283 (+),score=21.79 TRINITY_DN12212_c1_g1_i1:107-850(+)